MPPLSCLRRPLLAVACAAALPLSSRAATFLDDNFEAPAITGWAPYYATTPGSFSRVEESGNAYLKFSSPVSFRGVYTLLQTPVALSQGDTITVSFRLMFDTEPASNNVRFGLFRYGGGAQDGTSDDGYFASVTRGNTSVSISRDGDGGNDPTSGSANAITPGASTSAPQAFAADTWYDASITLTLLATGMEVSATVGGASATGVRTSGNFNTFGMFYIGSGGNNARFSIDDVLVTSSIPEPSAASLAAAFGALAAVVCLRRGRR